MGYSADEAAMAYGPGKGLVKGDQTTTTTVEYMDMSAFKGSWYRLTAMEIDLYFVWVDDATPTVVPAVTTVSGNGTMDFLPAGQSIERRIPEVNCFLAYATASGTGKMRISVDGGGDPAKS